MQPTAVQSPRVMQPTKTLHNGVTRKTKNNASRVAWQAKEKRYEKNNRNRKKPI